MRLFLIRHGQTTGDVEDRYGGDYDDHLTEVGATQASVLARRLRSEAIDRIFTSPKLRAKETAQVLTTKSRTQIEVIEGLREHNRYGVLTGMTKQEAKKRFPKLVAMLQDKTKTIEGAESYEQLRARVFEALHRVLSSNLERVAVVAHDGVIGCIFREIVIARSIKVHDCGYLVLQGEGTTFELVSSEGVDFLGFDDVPLPSK
jgi:broad specificity phosphatase PhoE